MSGWRKKQIADKVHASMINTYPTIYKRTNTGAVQIWFAEIDGGQYRTTSGQKDGKKTSSGWVVCEPKNVGRANATTAEQQAINEVEALYKKRLEKEYRKTIDEIDTETFFQPMLATKWDDRKDKVSGTVYMQPKLDGIRCIAKKDGLWTRQGKKIVAAPHIECALAPVFEQYPDTIFDGELYNHRLKDDFNAIVSCVKKQKPTAADLELSAASIEYHIYDLPSIAGNFTSRFVELINYCDLNEAIVIVETIKSSIADVDQRAMQYIEAGYEGAIVRVDGPYENKRSQYLIKWKQFRDEEFEIVDVLPGRDHKADKAASIVLRMEDGRTFNAGVIGNDDYTFDLLLDKQAAIGKQGTVVFFQYTPDNVPRFPKFKGVRWIV